MSEEKECVFCRIARGELQAWKIVENDSAMVILDTNPTAEGHCLIIPKTHARYWHELNDNDTAALFNTAKIVARKIKEVYSPSFVCVFIRGGRVRHTHVVLFPSYEGDALSGFPQSVLGKKNINFEEVKEKLTLQ